MPEDVTTLDDLQVIQVTSHGDITTADFKQTLKEILRANQEQGLTRVLVDATRVNSYPSTFPVYDFGSLVAESLRDMKIAIALSHAERGISEFFETVVLNRGGQIRTFDSPGDALAWLTNGLSA